MTTKNLVTGWEGFLGSHLTEKLVELGKDVRALVHYDSNNNWGWLENSEYKNDMEIILGDVRDYDSVLKAMKDCSNVFHLGVSVAVKVLVLVFNYLLC